MSVLGESSLLEFHQGNKLHLRCKFRRTIVVLHFNPTFSIAMPPTIALRVLLVEPYDDFRDVFATLLGLMGHAVEAVSNATEALKRVKASPPDVVLAELDLEDCSGLELPKWLRLLPFTEDVALIAITGYAQSNIEAVALEAGFDFFLAKPVTGEQVDAVFRTVAAMKGRKPRLWRYH